MNILKGQPVQCRNIDCLVRHIQDPDFEEQWMTAKSRASLRDIVLSAHKHHH